ncbi:hypothetical protein HNQ81_003406 [Desulfoprunum benzoelyticum]|uniref:Uncharacterized protein n=1 Tax=Desulfoprunum benzoelyticum TaxID=1506996 RepID=A0A840V6U2_9BACT|nr:hypothetical protein [Desulfoprunum benzoelyticum]MBB5349650.1 hypothetical protein [Desulfoprunum benzoelyticum]
MVKMAALEDVIAGADILLRSEAPARDGAHGKRPALPEVQGDKP